uniref:Syndecan n=1 Tax=Panagrolaimus sp. PS1159 TaxID=55785 RepID=A0AC35G195_9BILA
MHHFCIRAIIYALFISFVLSAQSSNPSDKNNNAPSLPIVEGSGSPSLPSRNGDKNVIAADITWEASGVGPDDEDGDVIEEGSGNVQSGTEVEGSGIPLSHEHQPIHTTAAGSSTKSSTTTTTTSTSTSRPSSTSSSPITIATTVITITTEETKRQRKQIIFGPRDFLLLLFGDGDDEEGLEATTPETTTTKHLTTSTTPTETTTTTKRPPSIAIGTQQPPSIISDSDDDAFHNMFKPGILAAITGGAVIGILLAILLVMFIIYRIRKKDEGSYSVDESSHRPHNFTYEYQKAATKEFYA